MPTNHQLKVLLKLETPTRAEVAKAIKDETWQLFRISLKGMSTTVKIERLYKYLMEAPDSRLRQVRVANYIGALKRGGQLSTSGEIQK